MDQCQTLLKICIKAVTTSQHILNILRYYPVKHLASFLTKSSQLSNSFGATLCRLPLSHFKRNTNITSPQPLKTRSSTPHLNLQSLKPDSVCTQNPILSQVLVSIQQTGMDMQAIQLIMHTDAAHLYALEHRCVYAQMIRHPQKWAEIYRTIKQQRHATTSNKWLHFMQ